MSYKSKVPSPPRTAAIYTLGCRANQAESDQIARDLLAHGIRLVPFKEKADLYIINTCTVTKNADKKARNILRSVLKRAQALKKPAGHDVTVVVTGCFVDSNPNLKRAIPGKYVALANPDKFKITKMLARKLPAAGKAAALPQKIRANLMIQNGCENYCSYCIVPYVRGKLQSATLPEMQRQAQALIKEGVREIILTGINLGAYGIDLQKNRSRQRRGAQPNLIQVIQALSKIRNLRRIRLSSIEPQYVTPRLIREIKNNLKVCKHLHLPMQSGADQILKAMRRQYSARQFFNLCRKLQKQIPNLAITTDVIVGFPGESDAAFDNTYRLAEEIGFARIHVFSFSPRPGTPAAKLPNQIDPKIIRQRYDKMNQLRNKLMQKFTAKFIGKKIEVLAEEYHAKGKILEGLTGNYLRVKFKGAKKSLGTIIKIIYYQRANLAPRLQYASKKAP